MSKFGESILRSCAHLASARPWWVVFATLVLTALAGYASTRLTIDTSTENILSAELPFRQIDTEYEATFPQEDLAVAVIDAPTSQEADAAARELLSLTKDHTDVFERVEVAGSSPYFDRYGLLFLSPEKIAEVGEEIRPARRLLTTLANDPSLRGFARIFDMIGEGVAESVAPPSTAGILEKFTETIRKVGDGEAAEMPWNEIFGANGLGEGTRRLVQLKPILNNDSINRASDALDALNAAIVEVDKKHPDITVRVTGEPVLRQQELNDAFSGALYASSLSFVLVALSLVIGIRSGRLIAALLLTLIVGSIWTTGLAAIAIGRLNLISVAFLVLFFGLGVDFGTHLGLRHLEEAKQGKSFRDALTAATIGEGPSIVLSAICAALAFLAFVPTTYTGLAEFGVISALGMLVAVVVTFTVQPALMALMPPRPKPGMGVTIGIGGWIARYHRIVLVLAVLVTGAAAYYALGVQIDTNPLNLQNPNTVSVTTYRDLARDPDTSPYALNVMAPDMDAAAELAPRLAAAPGVAGVRWIDDFIPRDQERKLAAIKEARDRLGEAFFTSEEVSAPSDAELAEAFQSIKTTAEAIANTPEDNPIEPTIIAAGKSLAAALSKFEQKRGAGPSALAELGDALSREMPAVVADLRK